MADIFQIVGKFAIEGADKAKKNISDVTAQGEKSSSALSKFGKVMGTVGKGVLAVGGAVTAGSVALVKGVQSSYGELQQNLGGSEAVYGQYASNIQEIAKDAYKNMGMSQSEYLATANKMGSLLQGSGIEQKEALDMTAKAMQRASDVASVMGIDMSMAMESITGACKGNFTMMDNLGVAMNATTLESYAMSKGMVDFSWNSATTAEKNALAMQMFLERTEQYAGNFARESTETITGSVGYLKAAWEDFMGGLGNPTADMARLTNNLAASFGAMINNIIPIIENIANALPIVLPSLIKAANDLIPTLINTFTTVVTKVIDAIVQLLPTVIPLVVDALSQITGAIVQNLPLLIDAVIQLINGVVQALPQLIGQLVAALPQIIPVLMNGIVNLIVTLVGMLPQIIQPIIDNLPAIIIAIVEGLTQNLPLLINGAIQLVIALVGALPQIIQALVDAIPTIVSTLVSTLISCAPQLIAGAVQVVGAVLAALPSIIISGLKAISGYFIGHFTGIRDGIGNLLNQMFTAIGNWLSNIGNKAKDGGKKFKDNLINGIKDLPNKIAYNLGFATGKVVKFAQELPQKAKEAGSKFVNNLVEFFKTLPSRIANWFNNTIAKVGEFANNLKAKAKEAGINFVNNLIDSFRSLPDNMGTVGKNIVTGLWNGIASSYTWVTGKIKEWCGSFIDGFKAALGIHSPSRVMRDEVGKPLVDGVAVGIQENSREVSKEFQKMLDDLQLKRDLDIINDSEYYSELEKLRDEHLEKGTSDWWEYTKEIIDYEDSIVDEQKENLDELNSDYEQHLKDREDLTSAFYDKLSASSLYNTTKIAFGDEEYSYTTLKNFDDEIKALDEFESKFTTVQERLKAVFVGDDESIKSMLDTIRSDPFGEGGNVLEAMLNSTDSELTTFANGYQQFIAKSKSVTTNAYADELAALDNNFISQISEKFANSPLLENLKNMGMNITENLVDGMNSKSEWMKEQILKFCSTINDTFNVGFGTENVDNSEFSGISERSSVGGYQPNYTEQLNIINDTVDKLIALVGQYLPDISTKMDRPIVINGDSLAVGISRKMDSQLGKISVSKGRGNV